MSDKPVAEKLFIKAGYRVLLINPPPNYKTLLGGVPIGVTLVEKPAGEFDLIQVFMTSKKELEEQLPRLKPFLKPKGLFWVTYPKGTSKVKADINRDSINAYAQTIGLIGIAMVSIDDTWSALRLKVG